MRSRPDKNHINGSINSDAVHVRGSEPEGTKTGLEKAGEIQPTEIAVYVNHAYPFTLSKVSEPPAPRPGVDFVRSQESTPSDNNPTSYAFFAHSD